MKAKNLILFCGFILILFGCCKTEIPEVNTLIGKWSAKEVYKVRVVDPYFRPEIIDTLENQGDIFFDKDSSGNMSFKAQEVVGSEQIDFLWTHNKMVSRIDFEFYNGEESFAIIESHKSDSLKLFFRDFLAGANTGSATYYSIILIKSEK